MKFYKKILSTLFIVILSSCSSTHYSNNSINIDDNFNITSSLYSSMINGDKANIAQLNLFFTKMPKGGDLHHHYTGSIYVETYLDWVKKKNWFINPCTFKIVKKKNNSSSCKSLSVSQLISNNKLYRKLLTLWSDKDYYNHSHNQPPPDSNFFNTFDYFSPISKEYLRVGLNILKQRAIKENVTYIETMLSRVGIKSNKFFSKNRLDKLNRLLRNAKSQKEVNILLDEITIIFLKNKNFHSSINKFIKKIEKNHRGIDNNDFIMRYQTYGVRVFPPMQVFTDLFSGYLAVEKSPLLVGVNIVAPENNSVALTDYTLHMQMYNYLLNRYPKVNRALHAGELTLGMVRPKNLTFHIEQAKYIAKAQRVGHGVDIPYEKYSLKILKELKKSSAIEINLSSNEFILGVKGDKHPYLIYTSYGVPIVISTDDSGVSRNNLSGEYVLLASRYKPSYSQIKRYVYNSIEYSFLTPKEKISTKRILDKKFLIFEKEMANFSNNLR